MLIVGWRYGFQPSDDNDENLSITHLEFREAGRQGVPRIALLQTDCPDVGRSDLLDAVRMPLVRAFRSEVSTTVRPAEFSDAAGLVQGLSTGAKAELAKLATTQDWVPGHAADLAARYAAHLAGSALGSARGAGYLDLLVTEQRSDEPGPDSVARPLAELVDTIEGPVIVSGEGGAGKSTALLQIAAASAARATREPSAPVPIYVDLAHVTVLVDVTDLHQVIVDSVSFAQDWPGLTDLGVLRDDRVVYLFDSLNELPDAMQHTATTVLARFMTRPHGRRVIVASRPSVHLEKLQRGAQRFEILRLRPEQVQEFLGQQGLATLYDRLPDELRELAANPFMLSAVARTLAGSPSRSMPRNRGRLYEQFVAGWIRKEAARRTAAYHDERVKQPLLFFLGTRMTALARTSLVLDEELEDALKEQLETLHARVRRRGGIPEDWTVDACLAELLNDGLLRREHDRLQFLHQSLQEYFAARHLARTDPVALAELTPRLPPDPAPTYQLPDVPAHRLVPVLLLVVGLIDDASAVITALAERHPVLAAAAIAAADRVDHALVAHLTAQWRAQLYEQGFARRALACACLSRTGRASDADIQALVATTIASTSGSWMAERALERLDRPADVARVLVDQVCALDEHDADESEFATGELVATLPARSVVTEIIRRLPQTPKGATRVRLGRLLSMVAEPARSDEIRTLTMHDPELGDAVQGMLADPSSGSGLQRGVRSLESKLAEVRQRAGERDTEATAAMQAASDADVAATVLSSDVVSRRAAIAEAMSRGLDVADALLELISGDDDPDGKPLAALTTALGPAAAVDALAAMGEAGDSEVAVRAARGIAEIDDPAATPSDGPPWTTTRRSPSSPSGRSRSAPFQASITGCSPTCAASSRPKSRMPPSESSAAPTPTSLAVELVQDSCSSRLTSTTRPRTPAGSGTLGGAHPPCSRVRGRRRSGAAILGRGAGRHRRRGPCVCGGRAPRVVPRGGPAGRAKGHVAHTGTSGPDRPVCSPRRFRDRSPIRPADARSSLVGRPGRSTQECAGRGGAGRAGDGRRDPCHALRVR